MPMKCLDWERQYALLSPPAAHSSMNSSKDRECEQGPISIFSHQVSLIYVDSGQHGRKVCDLIRVDSANDSE